MATMDNNIRPADVSIDANRSLLLELLFSIHLCLVKMSDVWPSSSNDEQQTSESFQNCTDLTKGQHETEVFEGEESEIPKRYNSCPKNPGHKHFIPITQFKMTDLPRGYRDIELFEFIKATADRTVRIKVQKVSPNRPKFWPNSKDEYPFCNAQDDACMRMGTGEIKVYKFIDGCGYNGRGRNYNFLSGDRYEREYKTCPCEKCKQSDRPKNTWWEIFIHTAAHVVFDDSEASHTTLLLFYDEHDSSSCQVNLGNVSVESVNVEKDKSKLKCVTCDEKLGNRLYELMRHFCELWKKVKDKYKKKSKFTFIVSHPHGCTKQVSVGEWVGNHKFGDYSGTYDLTKLTYTTSTCPGSSGAAVHCIGFGTGHFHSGTLGKVNYSGVGHYMKKV
nr:hypothetical protein BgiMline_031935 [Biomphalaria glabrata]